MLLMALRTSYTRRMVARALQLSQENNEKRWKVKLFFHSGASRMAGDGRYSYVARRPAVLLNTLVCISKYSQLQNAASGRSRGNFRERALLLQRTLFWHQPHTEYVRPF